MKKLYFLIVTVFCVVNTFGQTQIPENSSSPIYHKEGKVGIGTSNPTFKLDIKKKNHISTAWLPNLLLNNGWGGIGSEGLRIRSGKEGYNFDIFSYDHEINNDAFLGFNVRKGSINEKFEVKAQMVLTDDGYLGIGTTSPYTKFHVYNGKSGVNPHSFADVVIEDDDHGMITINTPNNMRGYFGFADSDDQYVGGMQYNHASDNLIFRVNNHTNDMMIDSNGYVGIGTSPKAKLDVAGNIKAQEIEVTLASMEDLQLNGTLAANNITVKANGQTADFVFEEDYNLKDLTEVEDFIKTNKHLPEIPSATEMEEKGVNLAEMNKLLLQKIEELTLYSIQQNSELKNLMHENKQLIKDNKNESIERKKLEERLAKIEALLLETK